MFVVGNGISLFPSNALTIYKNGRVEIGDGFNVNGNDTMDGVLRLNPRDNAPTPASQGDLYFDTDNNDLCIYDGTVWHDTTGGTCN